jgi:hypothetical protein
LQRETEGLLAESVSAYEQERQEARQQEPPRPAVPSRLFTGFWYQAGTWPCARFVVAKAEANDRGTNRRFVVTNRPGAALLPGPIYDEYVGRGESEIDQAGYRSSGSLALAQGFGLDLRDRHATGEISRHGLAVARGRLENRLSELIFPSKANAANETLAQHLWNHREELFTFLRQPGLDTTNWRAELAIRFSVILRKVWGGNRTWRRHPKAGH